MPRRPRGDTESARETFKITHVAQTIYCSAASAEHSRHLAVLHALDYRDRMIEALRDPDPQHVIRRDADLRAFARELADQLAVPLGWLNGERATAPIGELRQMSRAMAETRRHHRSRIMAQTATGETDPDTALAQLDAMRWLDRVAYHTWRQTWRAAEHLGEDAAAAEPPASLASAAAGADQRA